ncbi:ARS-binding protein 1 [Yarrowia sp. C11]|nr:ARS-binding protein 1 [Yarrowia sp. C11]
MNQTPQRPLDSYKKEPTLFPHGYPTPVSSNTSINLPLPNSGSPLPVPFTPAQVKFEYSFQQSPSTPFPKYAKYQINPSFDFSKTGMAHLGVNSPGPITPVLPPPSSMAAPPIFQSRTLSRPLSSPDKTPCKRPRVEERHEVSDYDRKWVRMQFGLPRTGGYQQPFRKRQTDVQNEFQERFGRSLSPSTISKMLSDDYSYLDTMSLNEVSKSVYRKRKPRFEMLEDAVSSWCELYTRRGCLSERVLKEAAERLHAHPLIDTSTADEEAPVFSNGWLHNIKTRRDLSRLLWDSTISEQETCVSTLNHIRETITRLGLTPKSVYAVGDTQLYPSATPGSRYGNDTTPCTARTVLICTNADGSSRQKMFPTMVGPDIADSNNRSATSLVYSATGTPETQNFLDFLFDFDDSLTEPSLLIVAQHPHYEKATQIFRHQTNNSNLHVIMVPARIRKKLLATDLGIAGDLKVAYKINRLYTLPHKRMKTSKILRALDTAWGNVSQEAILKAWRETRIFATLNFPDLADTGASQPDLKLVRAIAGVQGSLMNQNIVFSESQYQSFFNHDGEDDPLAVKDCVEQYASMVQRS